MFNKISIGSDHAGFEYKTAIISHLKQAGISVFDKGPNSAESVDYPDYIHPVAKSVGTESEIGIILCGSGNGAAITANKHQHIRASLCWNIELVALSRQHNNANILTIPARFISLETAIEMVDVFLSTPFEGGRHQNRVNKISCI